MISGVADLSPQNLITAYCNGAFPMADPDGIVRFYHANPRGIIPLDGLVVPRSLRQKINRRTFEIRFNHDFEQIIRACRDDRTEGSWINDEIVEAYCRLHTIGIAQSVEGSVPKSTDRQTVAPHGQEIALSDDWNVLQ
jgi:leucyl/phenylalanyl-tRNA--protein transferase